MKTWFTSALLAVLTMATPAQTENISFPPDSGVINVKERYGAKGDGVADDTAAIQQAFDENIGSGLIIYLPNGVYRITDTIRWAGAQNRNILQGQSETGTIIRLADHTPGFDNPTKPKNLIFTGGPPAQRFRNAVRNLTIDVGRGNPGAVGLNFCANNQGCVRHVTIRAGPDGAQPGAVGLALDMGEVGPLYVKHLTVIGFDLGIRVRHSVNSVTLEHITLRGQRVAGLDNHNNQVFLRKLTSDNAVPAVINDGPDGVVVILDSELRGGSGDRAALLNRHPNAVLFARNITTTGYGRALTTVVGDSLPGGRVAEWVSGPAVTLFGAELRTLNLPIEDAPDVPWDDLKDWVSPAKFGGLPGDGKDDTAAIQAAIDSGATTVYLPTKKEIPPRERANQPGWRGDYEISDTIYIRGNVRRIIGLDATYSISQAMMDQPAKPLFVFENGRAPVVIVERLAIALGSKAGNPAFVHQADRDLVIASYSGTRNLIHRGPGRLFVEDTVANEWRVEPGARVWARQLNLEGHGMKLRNTGGTVWVLGLKTEAAGPSVETIDGGRTEILGALLYKCVQRDSDQGHFFVTDAELSVAGGAEYAWTPSWATAELARETRAGETRSLPLPVMPPRGGAAMLPLFVAGPPAKPAGPPPAAPSVTVTNRTAGSYTLALGPADAAGFRIERDGALVAIRRGRYTATGLAPQTEHTLVVRAYDRFHQLSPPTRVTVATLPDDEPPTAPDKLRATVVTDQLVELAWAAAKDEIGVAGYEIERLGPGDKTESLGRQSRLEYRDTAVAKGTKYTYRVTAVDAAGNRSAPATLAVTTLAHAPRSVTVQLEKFDAKSKTPRNKGWYVGNLSDGQWLFYKSVELGRETPFTHATLRYTIPDDRTGAMIDVILDAKLEGQGEDRAPVGGTKIATFVLQGTGGWGNDNMKTITLPVTIDRPGSHSLLLVARRGTAQAGNAIADLDWLRFDFGEAK